MRRKISKERTTDQVFETRRAAFRAAKRDHGVPVCRQPTKAIHAKSDSAKDLGLDHRNRRLYIFEILLGIFGLNKNRSVHIREDKAMHYEDGGYQEKHFNAGGNPVKLRKHYYYRRR